MTPFVERLRRRRGGRRRALAALLPGVLIAVSAPAWACGPAEAGRFAAAAQSLAADAETLGTPLLSCAADADAAAQWLAFVLALRGDAAKSAAVAPHSSARVTGDASRVDAMRRARAGDVGALLAAVDAGHTGYANAADAQLMLARALVRKGQSARGQRAYADYLRLRPNDEDAYAESLFAAIWAGEDAVARARFRQAAATPLPPALAAAVARGLALLARRANGSGGAAAAARAPANTSSVPPPPLPPPAPVPPVVSAAAEAPAYSFGVAGAAIGSAYRRSTLRARLDDVVGVQVAAHELRIDDLERFTQTASEARVGAHARPGDSGLVVDGDVGYFAAGQGLSIGRARLGLSTEGGAGIGVGYERAPLALLQPLTRAQQDLRRDSADVSARIGAYAAARSTLVRDGGYAPFERHDLTLRWPLRAPRGRGTAGAAARDALLRVGEADGGRHSVANLDQGVALRLPISLEQHPRPSPLAVADAKTTAAGFGLEAGGPLRRGWRGRVVADYVIEAVTVRGPVAASARHALLTADGELYLPLGGAWELRLAGLYHRADDPRRLRERALASGVELGLTWSETPP